MGLNSLLRFFLPQDDKFLPLFEQSADNLKDAAQIYASLSRASSREDIISARDQIKKLEHVGDKLTHSIFEELNRSFVTPFDREDIYSLTKTLDDVLDLMDHVADILVLYRIEKVEDGMSMLFDVTRRAINDIHRSIHSLRNVNYDNIRSEIVSVHALENEGDHLPALHRKSIRRRTRRHSPDEVQLRLQRDRTHHRQVRGSDECHRRPRAEAGLRRQSVPLFESEHPHRAPLRHLRKLPRQ